MLYRLFCRVYEALVGGPKPKARAAEETRPAGGPAAGAGAAATTERTSTAAEAPAAREPKVEDDLTAIRGIGEATQRRLYAAGFTSYAELANARPDQVRAVLAGPGRTAKVEEWIRQAGQLAARQ